MKDFKFIVKTPPDEECIRNLSRVSGKILVDKYGVESIKQVL